jgi:hypothetical protein
MSGASYIRIWLASVIAVLGTVATFNLVIDPYDVSRILALPRLNAMKPAELGRARLRKPFDLWRGSYDGFALGASQVEHGIDPEHPGLSSRGLTLYNAGISEERPFEEALLLRHAAETTHVRFAIVALDFMRYVGGGGKPEFMPANWTRSRVVIDYLESLVSATAVRDSIATIGTSWDGTPTLQHLPDGLLNIEQYFSAVGQPDYRSQFNSVDAAYLNGAYKPVLDRRVEFERVGFDHSALADMLRTAARFNLELHVFIPPSHARQAEVVRFLGLEPLFRQWLRELACVVASTDSGRTSVRLWDFSGYNSVTTEAIPPFGSKDRMQWYQDSVHFSRRTGRAIVDTVLGFPPSELAKDQTFGLQVTPANIEEYFERRRLDRERYLAANPEIEAEITALYQGNPVPRGQARFSRRITQAVRSNSGNGRDQNGSSRPSP